MRYYLDNVNEVAPSIGFIGLTEEQLTENKDKLERLIAG